MRNQGKPIFDPFAKPNANPVSEHSIGTPDRRLFDIFRPCGHCKGSGRRKNGAGKAINTDPLPHFSDRKPFQGRRFPSNPECSQCILADATCHEGRWGRWARIMAHDLSEREITQLDVNDRMAYAFEIHRHEKHNHEAQKVSEIIAGGKTMKEREELAEALEFQR